MSATAGKASKAVIEGSHSIKSGCKINLYLEITGVLPNGYHSLKTYMVPVQSPCDTLVVSPLPQDAANGGCSCRVACAVPGIDLQNNTLTKAYNLYAQAVPQTPAIQVELQKGVPHGAGLGGGSADAATLLLFLNRAVQNCGFDGLEQTDLLSMAAKIGADVPFFILNTPAWAQGIGEKLTPDSAPLKAYSGMYLVLVCPYIMVSTPWAYAAWDKMQNNGAKILTSQRHQDTNKSAAALSLYNSFELPVFAEFPQLAEIKKKLLDSGAESALMSGSGSSLFGLFASKEASAAAESAFRNQGLRVYSQALHAGVSPSW